MLLRDVGFVTKCHSRLLLRYQKRHLCNKNQGSNTATVTFCDVADKSARQAGLKVWAMNTKAIYLTTYFLLSASPLAFGDMAASSTTDGLQLRYADPGSTATLSISHDITAGGNPSLASRSFLMDFELGEAPGAFTVFINKVKGSFTAHNQTQRLPASGLKGQSFLLDKTEDDRALRRTESDNKLQVGLGQMVGSRFPIGLALADILPILPEGPVTLGSRWQSAQDTRSLEGWAWAEGRLSSEHAVTAVNQLDGHTIVSITSTAHAQLSNVEGGIDYSGGGDLKRTSHWRFDATDGRLLSISMEQETSGSNTLPQGNLEVLQLTKVEYSSL